LFDIISIILIDCLYFIKLMVWPRCNPIKYAKFYGLYEFYLLSIR